MAGLSGKVAFVTGAGGGIGGAVAVSLADEGASVIVTDSREEAARTVAQEIVKRGGVADHGRLDVSSYPEIEETVQRVVRSRGRIDILVNCAGILSIHPFDEITEEIWDRMLDVNAKGTFFSCRAVAERMIEQGGGGTIVNISSLAGKIGSPFYTPYVASKFAVIGITKSLALELAKHKIRVNAVCPGDVDTEMFRYELKMHAQMRGLTVEAVREELAARPPLGRLAIPQDVADVVLFLVSEKSRYMTGQSLNVSGGSLMS